MGEEETAPLRAPVSAPEHPGSHGRDAATAATRSREPREQPGSGSVVNPSAQNTCTLKNASEATPQRWQRQRGAPYPARERTGTGRGSHTSGRGAPPPSPARTSRLQGAGHPSPGSPPGPGCAPDPDPDPSPGPAPLSPWRLRRNRRLRVTDSRSRGTAAKSRESGAPGRHAPLQSHAPLWQRRRGRREPRGTGGTGRGPGGDTGDKQGDIAGRTRRGAV